MESASAPHTATHLDVIRSAPQARGTLRRRALPMPLIRGHRILLNSKGSAGAANSPNTKKRSSWAALFKLPSISIVTDWIGQLCQGLEVYIVLGMMGLQRKQLFRGIDKNFPQVA